MAKRITKIMMQNHDLQNDTSIVRELEMVVDSNLADTTYAPQFWIDVCLYGIRGAYAYFVNCPSLVNNGDESLKEIESKIKEIEKLF